MCDRLSCNKTACWHVIIDDDESYNLCIDCLEFEDPNVGKIYKDFAKQIISLEIPA